MGVSGLQNVLAQLSLEGVAEEMPSRMVRRIDGRGVAKFQGCLLHNVDARDLLLVAKVLDCLDRPGLAFLKALAPTNWESNEDALGSDLLA